MILLLFNITHLGQISPGHVARQQQQPHRPIIWPGLGNDEGVLADVGNRHAVHHYEVVCKQWKLLTVIFMHSQKYFFRYFYT